MTTSIREQIMQAFEEKLSLISGVSGLTVSRNRSAAIVSYPSLVLYDGGESHNNGNSGATMVSMRVPVTGLVNAANDTALGPALNELYAKTVQAALSDVSLGGLAVDISLIDAETDLQLDVSKPSAAFMAEFEIQYWIAPGDPYSTAP